MKIQEAKQIINMNNLGKRLVKWNAPSDLQNHKITKKGKTLIGIGRWKNAKKELAEVFVCIAQGNELIYIEKPLWLKIAKLLP